jgi:thiosulfate/3-mercaptopyruvate sulfurtransferase
MPLHQNSRIPLGLIATLALAAACSQTDDQPAVPAMDSLVTAEWLAAHIDDPDLVVLDATVLVEQGADGSFLSVNGRPNYEAGHIPGAGFADLLDDLSDVDAEFEFTAPTPEEFAAAMGALGVGDNTRVVVYDTYNSVWAARVWWMLRWIGFDQAAVFDGGLNAWKAQGGAISTAPADEPVRKLSVALRPELLTDIDEVRASIDDDAVNVIDALPAESFRGDWPMYGRPGHIPGATNVSTFLLFDEEGRYRSHDELELLFEGDRNERAINYCGGGIAAAANAFVMHRLGFRDIAVYDNSLQEWAADPANPMETGTE